MTSKKKAIITGIIIYAILVLLIYFFRLGGENYISLVNAVTIINPLIAIIAGYSSIRFFGRETAQGKSVLFLMHTIIFWWLGDLIWWIFADNAIVSSADLFWLFAYITFMLCVYYGSKVIQPRFDYLKNKLRIAAYLSLFIVVSAAYFKLFPMLWEEHMTFLENLLTSGYVLADFLLIIAVLFMIDLVYMVRKGSYKTIWILIGIATLFFLWGDVAYAVYHETYEAGDLMDATWAMSYLIYAISFVVLRANAEAALEKANDAIAQSSADVKKKMKRSVKKKKAKKR